MYCPFCKHLETQVTDSRVLEDGSAIRRRRMCSNAVCHQRFTTFERAELQIPTLVKKNGARVSYDATKLRASLMLALRKRQVPIEKIDNAMATIETTLLTMPHKEVQTQKLGELVMKELKQLDMVAYIRFASVYQSFTNIDEFMTTIDDLKINNKDNK